MHDSHKFAWLAVFTAFVAVGAVAATPPTAATTAREGITNAKIHATVASKIDTLQGVHLHLHHVVNCLEGPHGKQYSAKAEASSAYHCDAIEVGAANDTTASPQVHKLVQRALDDALAGIQSTSVVDGHKDAEHVVDALNAAEQAWPKKS